MDLSIRAPLTNAPAALVQKRLQRRPLQIVVLHALSQHVDPLLQHRADARIAPGFDQVFGESVLFVGQRDRGFHRHIGTPFLEKNTK